MGKYELFGWTMASDVDKNYYADADVYDSWKPTDYNQMYFTAGLWLYFMMVHFAAAEWVSLVISTCLVGVWQIKNALIPGYGDDEVKYFGGYGFDYYAMLYGVAGSVVGILLDLIAPPHIRGSGYQDDEEDEEDWEDEDDF